MAICSSVVVATVHAGQVCLDLCRSAVWQLVEIRDSQRQLPDGSGSESLHCTDDLARHGGGRNERQGAIAARLEQSVPGMRSETLLSAQTAVERQSMHPAAPCALVQRLRTYGSVCAGAVRSCWRRAAPPRDLQGARAAAVPDWQIVSR